MPHAKLTIRIPEMIWIGSLTRSHPETTIRIIAALPNGDTGAVLAEIDAPNLPTVVAKLEAEDHISDLEILKRSESTILVQFHTSAPKLLGPLRKSGVPLPMPFTIQDGEVRWDVTAPQDRLSELADRLDDLGIPFTVEELHQHVEPTQLLTERQLGLLQAAVRAGYYDTPRTCSLTDLADQQGLAKSTCSETLHRAEGKVIKKFLERTQPRLIETNH